MKKISVVIATFQRPMLMKKCIMALADQHFDHDDYEIIVVSDGPDDETRQTINELRFPALPFVQYIALPENCGPAAARNAGWKSAQSPLVAFTDDDCVPQSHWLAALWKVYTMLGCPEHIAFSGKVEVPVSEYPTDYERNIAQLEEAGFITANCACTKAGLELIGGFDERFKTAWREDSDLEFGLIKNRIPIFKVNGAVIVHPVRNVRWGVSIYEQKKTMFNALLYKKYPSLFRQKIQAKPEWNYYAIVAGFFAMVAGIVLQQGALFLTGGLVYLCLTSAFIFKRLMYTRKSYDHIAEMIITSLCIPFLSVYWTIYGSVKYRVLYY